MYKLKSFTKVKGEFKRIDARINGVEKRLDDTRITLESKINDTRVTLESKIDDTRSTLESQISVTNIRLNAITIGFFGMAGILITGLLIEKWRAIAPRLTHYRLAIANPRSRGS